MKIFMRKRWNPRGGKGPADGVKTEGFVHHSVTDGEQITWENQAAHTRYIEYIALRQNHRGIDYNFLVFQPHGEINTARVVEARGFHHIPAAQLNHNTGTLAVCIVGDGRHDGLHPSTIQAIAHIFTEANRRGHKIRTIQPHSAVTPTACPGPNFYHGIPAIRGRFMADPDSHKVRKWKARRRRLRGRLSRILRLRRELREEDREDSAYYRWTTRAMRQTRWLINRLSRLIARDE